MKIRRFRRRRRRYRMKRKRYSTLRRQKPRQEVKVWDTTVNGKGAPLDIAANGDVSDFVILNMLNYIVQGTNAFQRVGNRIYVKFIQVRVQYWTCGFKYRISATDYPQTPNTGLLRIIVHDSPDPPFQYMITGSNAGNKVGAPLNRKSYNIYYDKVLRLQGGLGNNGSATATSASSATGDIRQFKFNIPVNRNITYAQADSGASLGVKDTNSVYSVSAISAIPNSSFFPINASNTVAPNPICCNWSFRVYFTDA